MTSAQMLSYEEALHLLSGLPVQQRLETVALQQALGRVLGEAVTASSDQPPFDRTTMDGFAVRLKDGQTRYEVIDEVLAGQRFEGTLQPGQAVRIMTGAPCPAGATVVPVERTQPLAGSSAPQASSKPSGEPSTSEWVEIEAQALVPGKNVAWQGQDARAGAAVLEAGTRLAPQTLSAAAMAGAQSLACFRPPVVAIVTTGDEIGASGPAAVRNSNGPLLEALCSALGVAHRAWHALDQPSQLAETLRAAQQAADIVVSVGGVSMGSADLVPGAVEGLGFQRIFHKVAMQPGKPLYLAQHPDATCFLGLPGNPVSVLATAHLFLAPLIGRFLGNWSPDWLDLPLAGAHAHKGARRLFLPAKLGSGGVTPIRWNGSGDFYSAARGDGLVDLPPQSRLEAGALVRYLPYLGHVPGEVAVRPNDS